MMREKETPLNQVKKGTEGDLQQRIQRSNEQD